MARLKKRGTILWSFQMMVILGFVAFFFVTVGFGGVNEAVRTSARLEAEKIAGIINSMIIAPPGTEDTYVLTGQQCRVVINSNSVVFYKDEKTFSYVDLIESKISVTPYRTSCTTNPVTITFKRDGTRLTIS